MKSLRTSTMWAAALLLCPLVLLAMPGSAGSSFSEGCGVVQGTEIGALLIMAGLSALSFPNRRRDG